MTDKPDPLQRLTDVQQEIEIALTQPEQEPVDTCTWTHDDDEGSWDAECGERWSITEGTPEENNFRFCPGCGRKVETICKIRGEK